MLDGVEREKKSGRWLLLLLLLLLLLVTYSLDRSLLMSELKD